MKNALLGKKTYIISALTALVGVLQLLNGHQYTQVLPYLLAGAFGAALRAAFAKAEAKIDRVLEHYLPAPIAKAAESVVDSEVAKVEGQ